jgi:hypothetical protein
MKMKFTCRFSLLVQVVFSVVVGNVPFQQVMMAGQKITDLPFQDPGAKYRPPQTQEMEKNDG